MRIYLDMCSIQRPLDSKTQIRIFVPISPSVEEQARIFSGLGIKPLDALHLASSFEAQANYFCTCDDRFLRRAKDANTGKTKVVSILEMIMEIG